MTNYADHLVSFIWDVADLLRGPLSPPEYRKVMLPMTVLRKLEEIVIGRMDRNSDQVVRFLDNAEVREFVTRLMRNQVYSRIQQEAKAAEA